MFREYNDKFPPYELKKVPQTQIRAVRSSVFKAVGKGRNVKIKPLIIITAAVFSALMLGVGANAASGGALIKLFIGGGEIEAYVGDYVDDDGYRHISFFAEIPIDENNFAIIFDTEKPNGENVRVLTDENAPDFMERLRKYKNAWSAAFDKDAEILAEKNNDYASSTLYYAEGAPSPKEFGIEIKDTEICEYELESNDDSDGTSSGGSIGGEFMHSGIAEDKPSGVKLGRDYDYENGIKTYRYTLYYYVGKDAGLVTIDRS